MMQAAPDSEVVLSQFNRLIRELLRGSVNRNTFQPWEVELLLDFDTCEIRETGRREVLKRYQKAVQKQMEKGAPMPMKLSEYLSGLKERRRVMAAGSAVDPGPAR
jgi:hypothetical protein